MFASMSAAFDGLSDRMQQFISGLEAVHDFKPFRELFDDSEEERKNVMRWEQLYPPALHPVVRVHPVTGRKVLFVNPQFTVAIKNMDERESKSLLDILFQQAQIPEYQFRHHWAPHTLIMWDNRSTQHYAVNDYFPQRRYMERVTIKGGAVEGIERADPETVRKAIRRTTGSPICRLCRSSFNSHSRRPHGSRSWRAPARRPTSSKRSTQSLIAICKVPRPRSSSPRPGSSRLAVRRPMPQPSSSLNSSDGRP
jgi:hypothetical protein